MNPPLDSIPDEEWYCSQCDKNNNFHHFMNNAKDSMIIENKINLRERHHLNNSDRVFTRSFYNDKKFEYKELDEDMEKKNEEDDDDDEEENINENLRVKTRSQYLNFEKKIRKERESLKINVIKKKENQKKRCRK